MHIGIDASRLATTQRTGTERYSSELIAALARIDRKNRYTLYTNGIPERLPLLGPNVELCNIPLARLWTHGRLGPELALNPPDVTFIPAHVLPITRPRPAVVTIHDLGYLTFPQAHTARRRLELDLSTRWNVQAASLIIAISQATARDLTEHYRVPPEKIHVVYHGLALEQFHQHVASETIAEVQARYNIPGRYLLYVGTLQPRKNLVRLVESFAPLAADHPDLTLVLAGKRGWLSEPIEAKIAALGLQQQVRLTDYLPDKDLVPLLAGARAFVFPSLYEGFGLPVLEAMACGVPVITSTTSSLPEVAGNAALLVDPQDSAALTSAMARLLTDDTLHADLHRRGLMHVQTFTWERCATQTLAVLREAAANQR